MPSLSPRKAMQVLERRLEHLRQRIYEQEQDNVPFAELTWDVRESRAIETALTYVERGLIPSADEEDGIAVQHASSDAEAVRVILVRKGKRVAVLTAEWDDHDSLIVRTRGNVVMETEMEVAESA